MMIWRVFLLFGFVGMVVPVFGAAGVVYHPENPEPEELEAAEELARYWEKLTGERLEVRSERRDVRRPRKSGFGVREPVSGGRGVRIFVGETEEGEWHVPLSGGLNDHGFRIRKIGSRIYLRGRTPVGSRFAVAGFLQRYGGIRWYMPTELGEHIPEKPLRLPRVIDREESPDFVSRRWSRVTNSGKDPWLWRNRLAGADQFSHAIHSVFTEAVYEERPDFFMMLNGRRVRPDDRLRGLNLQICFGNPDAPLFAAKKAAEFFDKNPDAMSFSLGMTDTKAICECDYCAAWIDPEKRFRDRPDYSDLVFGFMNRAAEELSKSHPDKFLGCLAYYWAENVPTFPVHPQVMPYLTADRSQWRDPGFRKEDRDLMERWMRAGPERVGIYDYYYGTSFIVPRLFNRIVDESLKHAAAVGIDGFYAEIGSVWSLDGPKAWLASQLLWDSSQDAERLLDDYYRNFFGSAARPMRRYFELAEQVLMEQGGAAFWLKFYHDPAQLELFPPEVTGRMRDYLREAESVAVREAERARVRFISEGFRKTELYSGQYFAIRRAVERPVWEMSWAEISEEIGEIVSGRRRLDAYVRDLNKNELHREFRPFEERVDFFTAHKLNRLFERAAELALENEKIAAGLSELVLRVEQVLPEARAAEVVEFAMGDVEALQLRNGDFEEDDLLTGLGDLLAGEVDYTPFFWRRETEPGADGAFSMSRERAFSGEFCINARGAVEDRLYQAVSVAAGDLVRLSAQVRGRVSAGSEVDLEITWRGRDGGIIKEKFPARDRMWPGVHEEWGELLVVAKAPRGTERAYVSVAVRRQGPEDSVDIDDVKAEVVRAGGVGL